MWPEKVKGSFLEELTIQELEDAITCLFQMSSPWKAWSSLRQYYQEEMKSITVSGTNQIVFQEVLILSSQARCLSLAQGQSLQDEGPLLQSSPWLSQHVAHQRDRPLGKRDRRWWTASVPTTANWVPGAGHLTTPCPGSPAPASEAAKRTQ